MNKESKIKMLTMINLASSILTMGITMLINFFLSPYIVTNLGEEANGFVQLANNFIMYASLITLALNSMGARFITISYHKKEVKQANRYYSSLIIGNAIIIGILIIPAIFCIYKLENIINISSSNIVDVKILFALVFFTFFVTQIISIFNIATYVTNELYITNIVGVIRVVLNAILLIFIFATFNPRIYFVSLVALLLSIVTLLSSYAIKKKVLSELKFNKSNFSNKCIKELISSGIWNTINQCGHILMTGLDLLLTNLFIGPIQMGILSVAKTIPNSIIQLAGTINSNFSPAMVIAYSTDEKEYFLKQLRTSMKISSVLISIPIMVFCTYGIEFYKLWMPTLDSLTLARISILTCMTFIPFAGPQVLYNVYTVTNKLRINSATFMIGGILNIVLMFIALKYTSLGIYAVAGISSSISIIRNLCVTVPYTAKLLGLRWYEFYKDVLISTICCILCGIVAICIKRVIIPNSWGMLILSILIACCISLIVNIWCVLDKTEKRVIKSRIFR